MELVKKEVEFHNSKLVGIQKDGKIYTPINYFCDILGVNLASQFRKSKVMKQYLKGLLGCNSLQMEENKKYMFLKLVFVNRHKS